MIKKWIILPVLLLCSIQPCLAQATKHHKTASKHKPVNHTVKHVSKHKPKHHSANKNKPVAVHQSSYESENAYPSAHAKLASLQEVPQPQFDTNYSSDSTNTINTITLDDNSWQKNENPITPATDNFIDTSSQTLTSAAYKTVETLRYSSYKLGGTLFNPTQGVYKIDCSAYINDLLSQANPQAYSTLTNSTQTYKPTSLDYFNFINRLPANENTPYWRKIMNIEQLKPGGILVFRNTNPHHRGANGHVMLVMSKPVLHPSATDTYQVKVADSASSGHSYDTRSPHQSGIGIGTLLLKVDPITGHPRAYAWRMDDHWRSNALFAMAQPFRSV